MRALDEPLIEFSEVLGACFSGVSSSQEGVNLESIRPDLSLAAEEYQTKAPVANLHQIPPFIGSKDCTVVGLVTRKALTGLYSTQMVPEHKVARRYYDILRASAPGSMCPFCGVGVVSTLDHYLPKSKFPLLAVLPSNLVPCCKDCNTGKLAGIALSAEDQCLHPYYDHNHFTNEQWVFAHIEETNPATINYYVDPPADWTLIDRQRVEKHFNDFDLGGRYSIQAASELATLGHELLYDYQISGSEGVRAALIRKEQAARTQYINSWKVALYQALAESEWFCDRGGW